MKPKRIQAIEKIQPIQRGADLTDDDLRAIVDDFYVVRNWAALQAKMGPDGVKRECLRALECRLGRREQIGPFGTPKLKPLRCVPVLKDESGQTLMWEFPDITALPTHISKSSDDFYEVACGEGGKTFQEALAFAQARFEDFSQALFGLAVEGGA